LLLVICATSTSSLVETEPGVPLPADVASFAQTDFVMKKNVSKLRGSARRQDASELCLEPVDDMPLDLSSLVQADFFLKKRNGTKLRGEPRRLSVADLDLCLGPESDVPVLPPDASALFQADIRLLKKNHNASGIHQRTSSRRAAAVDVEGHVDSDPDLCTQPDDEYASLMQSDLKVSRRAQADDGADLVVSERPHKGERPDTTALFQLDVQLQKSQRRPSTDTLCTQPEDDDAVTSLMQADIVVARRELVGVNPERPEEVSLFQADFKVVNKHNATGTLRLKTSPRSAAPVDAADAIETEEPVDPMDTEA